MSAPNQKKRGVRFTEESIAHASERIGVRHDDNNNSEDEDYGSRPPKRQKRPRQDRPNEDELDDLDDFVAEDDSEIPSETQTLRAKRERRLKQAHDDDDDVDGGTKIDNDTSLAAEGIPIEPFHMNEENTDGTGYFDGDTYVFRRGGTGEEPDAWLDSIEEKEDELVEASSAKAQARLSSNRDGDDESQGNGESGNKMDSWTDRELYAQIIPFVSDSETVMRAIARYGNLLKRKNDEADTDLARKAMNDLTEAASALLLRGQHDIYEKTRKQLAELLSDKPEQPTGEVESTSKPVVQWEYRGSQDNQVHGPFTTQQMQGWIQQGYFVGPSAVMARSIHEVPADAEKSQRDDLLSDLLEDDDEDEPKPSTKVVKGDWTKSDQIDFSKYA